LHYVRGGSGPAIVLLHGFPQDWYEWRHVMPRLARRFTVVAVDLRGVGGSEPTGAGYDAATLAEDVHRLARQLKLGRYYVAGHDIGGMVTYALARLHPRELRGAMIVDVPLPGIDPWPEVEADPLLWHFRFHQTAKVPESLVTGRQQVYFRQAFFDRLAARPGAITDQDVAHYARAYSPAARLRAGFEFYRAFPETSRFNRSRRSRLDLPIVLAGGDQAVGRINPRIAEALRRLGCRNVTTELVRDSGHYVPEEQPDTLAALLERHAAVRR
jgi:pimeloyl-ACP methyl ester carboxylesterase